MSDFKITNKIVQANELVQQTSWSLNEIPLKIFKVLVSCIDTSKKEGNDTITISKNELMDMVGKGKNYHFLEKQLEYLLDEHLILYTGTDRVYLSILESFKWSVKDEDVTIKFAPTIMPFLVELKERFLQYDVAVIKELNSKYSLIIYEYLLSKERRERNKHRTYRIDIRELRRLTDTIDKYPRILDFEKRVLIAAKEEINNTRGLEFLVTYEKVKNSRRITAIDFKIRKRTSYKETEFDDVAKPEWLTCEI